MNVLLLSPASDADRCQRNKYITYAPLTLPALAALVPDDCEVRIVDEKVEAIDMAAEADLVGITAITGTANRSYEVADAFRRRGCTVGLGGPHPTVCPEEAAQHADCVVMGQAYTSWPLCIEDFRSGRLQPRYCDDGLDGSAMPLPRRSLLQRGRYFTTNSVQATLGCPNQCKFCIVSKVFGQRYVTRPVDQVVEEIAGCEGSSLFFVDVNLIADPEYAKALFRAMIPLRRRWAAQVTTQFTDDAVMLDLAARAGCKGVFIGVESLNQESLSGVDKKVNDVRYYAEMQARLRAHGICSMLGIVYGFDHDDPGVFDRTMKFMDRVKADAVRYGVLTPFPGTALYDELSADGRIFDHNWDHYDSDHVVFRPRRMTPEALQQGFVRSMNHTYSVPSILWRILGSRSYLPLSLAVNYAYFTQSRRLFGGRPS